MVKSIKQLLSRIHSFSNNLARNVFYTPSYAEVWIKYIKIGIRLLSPLEMQVLKFGDTQTSYVIRFFKVRMVSGNDISDIRNDSAGFAFPKEVVANLNKSLMSQTTMATECKVRTATNSYHDISNNKYRIGYPSAIVREEQDDNKNIETVVPLYVALISTAVSNVSLEDDTFDLLEELVEGIAESVSSMYDTLIPYGDGDGKMRGIFSSPDVKVITHDGYLTADLFTSARNSIVNCVDKMRSKWYMNSNTGLDLFHVTDEQGDRLIKSDDKDSKERRRPEWLMGDRIVYNEFLRDNEIIYGNLSRAYLIVKGVQASLRRFVDGLFAERDQVLFLIRVRLGGQVVQPKSVVVIKPLAVSDRNTVVYSEEINAA